MTAARCGRCGNYLPVVPAGGPGPRTGSDGLATGAADRALLGSLPEAPVCLVAGPAGKDAAVRKAARAGDGVIRAVQPGQALAVGAAGESGAALRERLGAAGDLSLCDLSDARVRFSLSGLEAAEIIATPVGDRS